MNKKKGTKAVLGSLLRELSTLEALKPEQMEDAAKAARKISDGVNQRKLKLVEEGISQFASVFLRRR